MSDSVTPWTTALQAPLPMGFPRQEYWSVLPFPSPGYLPHTGIEPGSPIFIDHAKAFDCVDHNKLWKILQEMGLPDHLPPEKSVCRKGINNCKWTWNNRLVPNRKRSTSRLYIVTLLI